MGITKGGVFGNVQKKIGDVTFRVLKGQNVLSRRSIPANPKTEKQTEHRTKMAKTVEIWQKAKEGNCTNLYSPKSGLLSAYNQFIKDNINNFTNLGAFDYIKWKFANGTMVKTNWLYDELADSILSATWETPITDVTQKATDIPYIIIWNIKNNSFKFQRTIVPKTRTNGQGTFSIDETLGPNDLYIFSGFTQNLNFPYGNNDGTSYLYP